MSPYIVPGLKEKKEFIRHYNPNITHLQRMDKVTEIVCCTLKIKKEKVLSKNRCREYVTARHMAMFFIRKYYPYISLKSTGNYFGGRDHTTAIHAVQSIKNLMQAERKTREIVDMIDDAFREYE